MKRISCWLNGHNFRPLFVKQGTVISWKCRHCQKIKIRGEDMLSRKAIRQVKRSLPEWMTTGRCS